MTKISREDVIKLAELSRIDIAEDEIENVRSQLQNILSYAQRVKEIAKDIDVDFKKNVNIFAQDKVLRTDVEPIISQAPEHEENFFIVPRILEEK